MNLNKHHTQLGESVLETVLLICTSEDNRWPVRLVTTTWCGPDSVLAANFIFSEHRMPSIVLSFINI